ncbi:MAG TPA: hypothetical protein VGC36_07675 [Rhizomicrobium sp.]
MTENTDVTPDALDRFRAAVLADSALQDALQGYDDGAAFIPRALALAEARDIHVAPEDLRRALRSDLLGIARWSDAPPSDAVPQRGWLPVNVLPAQGELCIDWAYFGGRPLDAPFYEDSVRRALSRPLNRLARHRSRLIDLPDMVARLSVPRPRGFIFHMSRCGSTLVSQMLAGDPRNIVISEAAPIDAVVRLDPGSDGAPHAALLAAMVSAFGQRRTSAQAHCFVKLDSWHTIALPLFRRAFPDVPWVFLYREPGAVLASQMNRRGIQTLPEYLPPALFGLELDDGGRPEDYCARVLARTCEAVLEPFAQGGGLLVKYSQLPGALWTAILPHFGIAPDADDRARMAVTAGFDAKAPQLAFSGRAAPDAALQAIAERHIGGVYGRLEALRGR